METLDFLKALGLIVILGGVAGLLVIGVNEYLMGKD